MIPRFSRILLINVLSLNFLHSQMAYGDSKTYLKTDCIGPQKAKHHMVYLHGWDSPNLGDHEKRNRSMLRKLAKKNQWRIALPRGNGTCSDQNYQCWNLRSKAKIKESWSRLLAGANQCFPASWKTHIPWGIVGFSNGGYFSAAIHNLCLKPNNHRNGPHWLLAFGSAALGRVPMSKPWNKSCPRLDLASGTNDRVSTKARKFSESIRKKGGKSHFYSFKGGHVVHWPTLERFLLQE